MKTSKTIILVLLLFVLHACEDIQSPVIIITNNKCENGIITIAEVHKQWELIDSVVVITEITEVIMYTDSIGFQTIDIPVKPGRYSVTLDCMILDYVDLSSKIHYVVDSEVMGAWVTDYSTVIYIEFR